MTPRERFLKTLNFEKPDDRLAMIEWAPWWDQTIERWKKEGLAAGLEGEELVELFGLDHLICLGCGAATVDCPREKTHGAGILTDEASYEKIKPYLFQDSILEGLKRSALELKPKHDAGAISIRLWLDGFFWFPRAMLGIERHLYSFYDQAELLSRINQDLADFNVRAVEALFPVIKPDMVGFAEDFSYNNGPMLSYKAFKEFMTPYYRQVIPHIKKYGVKVLVDSDGDIHEVIPWLTEAGLEGIYPLERQAGVDLARIRREHPRFLMMGGYDKLVMDKGEVAMRAEFERLLPVMRSGGYIPSVDHQTPPGVSLENYKVYLRLFREYCEKASR